MTKLDRCWKNCRRMWTWIIKNLPEGFSEFSIGRKSNILITLKEQWLNQHRFTRDVENNCFFCDYAGDSGCFNCPGSLVNPEFRCYRCGIGGDCHWIINPIAFEAELARLDAIRKGE